MMWVENTLHSGFHKYFSCLHSGVDLQCLETFWCNWIHVSIYTLSDLGALSNLIGSLSLAYEHYSPPTKWIMRKPNKNKMAGVNSRFASVLESEILKIEEDAVPENTKKAMKFGMKLFRGKRNICHLPGGRSVWEKSVPEVLSTYSRPRTHFFPYGPT